MTTDTDPRVAEAMRLHKLSTRSHHVWQTLRALGEQDERAQAAVDDHTALMTYLAAEFDKVPSAPVEAVPQGPRLPDLPNGAWQRVSCAVCFDAADSQRGWIFIPHADGKWVSLMKLPQFSEQIIRYWLDEPNDGV